MLPPLSSFRQAIRVSISSSRAEGHEVEALVTEFHSTPDSYDALLDIARRLAEAPLRADWQYVEPDDLDAIWQACDSSRPTGIIGAITPTDAAMRVETAFLSSVCGCILGKPIEVDPTFEEIRQALELRNEWPLSDYISRDLNLRGKRDFHHDYVTTCRENISFAAADDDINYTILGMLNLEQNGINFTLDQLRELWLKHQSLLMTFGPERSSLIRSGLQYWAVDFEAKKPAVDYHQWTHLCNPFGEKCGAMIRADAYGYACPAQPALAAELAWRDASFTHRGTGLYGTMFVAAAIAAAFVEKDPLRIFEIALQFVPQQSRFYQIVADSLREVREASDWIDGYKRIHGKYKEYTHCRVYQECGTLINTMRFAVSIDDGFCKQVSQGNDTDSFGATSGSILGLLFGPGHLDPRWLAPFHDKIQTGLNLFYEQSLTALARRVSDLPKRFGTFISSDPA